MNIWERGGTDRRNRHPPPGRSNGHRIQPWRAAQQARGLHAQLSEPQRKHLAQTYADRALATLRQAVQNGYKDLANLKKDKDLDSLRSREDFKKLLAELELK